MARLDQFIEYQIYVHIFRIFLPILLVLGTAGNVISTIVLIKPKNRNSSTVRFLLALAVSDLLALWVIVPGLWLHVVFGFNLRDYSEVTCKCHCFLSVLSGELSAMYCVALSVGRCVSVMLPLKTKFICSLRNTNIAIISIAIVLLLFNLHLFFTIGLTKEGTCARNQEIFSTLPMKIWIIFQGVVIGFLPLVILLAANVCIIVKLVIRNRFLVTKSVNSNSKAWISAVNKKTSRMTTVLILVSVSFLLSVIPLAMFFLLYGGKQLNYREEHHDAVILLFWSVAVVVYLTSNAINFLLYSLSGSKFRKEVIYLFCPKRNC